MNGKQFQFNRRSIVSLGLAVLILTMTAIPALAWEDEGGPDFKPVRSCRVSVVGEGLSAVACGKTTLQHPRRVVSEQPSTALGVIRAEIIFLRGWQPAHLMVKAGQEE